MPQPHPNVARLQQLDLRNLDACADLFAPDFVWHYVNPNLPEVEGDYHGLDGLQDFFARIGSRTRGTFRVDPVSITACGDELVVTHTVNTMTLDDRAIAVDVVEVWRFVNGQIAEAWDIPSAHTLARPVQSLSPET